ncbi:MAG: hypothetical protein Q8P45_02170 [Candidatus Harrisonbacteria bacterium]|nr:hypothetical protein [Candidatus Harrisonbacteria bacterium]
MNRKNLLLIFVIVVFSLIALGLIIWLFFFGGGATTETPATPEIEEENLVVEEISFPENISFFTEIEIGAYWPQEEDGSILFLSQEGLVYQYFPETGEITEFDDINIEGYLSADLSLEENHILIRDNSGEYFVYSLETREKIRLPIGIRSAVWSGSDLEILFFSEANQGGGGINIFNIDTLRSRVALAFQGYDFLLQSGADGLAYLISRASRFSPGELWQLSSNYTSLSKVEEKPGLMVAFSPYDSSRLVFSNSSLPKSAELIHISASGVRRSLDFVTLPSKCAFVEDGDFACAVPSESAKNYPDEYLQGGAYTNDRLVFIDGRSGQQTTLFSSKEENSFLLDAKELKIVGERLYFINRYDQRLYSIDL